MEIAQAETRMHVDTGLGGQRRVSWVKMLRRLSCDRDYLMIDVIGATPVGMLAAASSSPAPCAFPTWRANDTLEDAAGDPGRFLATCRTRVSSLIPFRSQNTRGSDRGDAAAAASSHLRLQKLGG